MVVFFTEKLQPWKTKLNKLLFYSDFIMHQQTGFSMSGVQYRAIPMGPVPNNYNSIFEYLTNKHTVDVYYTNFADGGTGEQFKPNQNKAFNSELFAEIELGILNAVADRFKYTSTAHQGFDKHLELTEAEIFALVKPRQLRRKYIIKKV